MKIPTLNMKAKIGLTVLGLYLAAMILPPPFMAFPGRYNLERNGLLRVDTWTGRAWRMNANGWRPIEEPQAFDLEPIADALRDATRHAEPEDLRADLAGEVSRWNEVTRDLEYQALNASERQEVANALLTKRIKPLKQFQRLSPTSQAHIAGLIDSGQLVPFPLPSE